MRSAHADEIRRLDVARPERPIEELAVFRRCDLGHLHFGRRDEGAEVAHRVVRTGQRATVHRGKIAERLGLGKSRNERRLRTEDGLHIRFVPFLQIPFDEAIARGGHGSQANGTGVIPTRIGRALPSADLHCSRAARNNQRFEFVLAGGQPINRCVARQRYGHASALSRVIDRTLDPPSGRHIARAALLHFRHRRREVDGFPTDVRGCRLGAVDMHHGQLHALRGTEIRRDRSRGVDRGHPGIACAGQGSSPTFEFVARIRTRNQRGCRTLIIPFLPSIHFPMPREQCHAVLCHP